MRTISDDTAQPAPAKRKSNLLTFSTTLTDGRQITIREMTGRDLIFLEKDLSKEGDIAKSMKLIERLIVSDDKITYDEILDLGVRDFKKMSELIAKANGDEEDPN